MLVFFIFAAASITYILIHYIWFNLIAKNLYIIDLSENKITEAAPIVPVWFSLFIVGVFSLFVTVISTLGGPDYVPKEKIETVLTIGASIGFLLHLFINIIAGAKYSWKARCIDIVYGTLLFSIVVAVIYYTQVELLR